MADFNPYTSVCLMREDHLASELTKARERLAELEREEQNRKNWPPEMKLAIRLHDRLCQARDCDFYYQFGKDGIQTTNTA